MKRFRFPFLFLNHSEIKKIKLMIAITQCARNRRSNTHVMTNERLARGHIQVKYCNCESYLSGRCFGVVKQVKTCTWITLLYSTNSADSAKIDEFVRNIIVNFEHIFWHLYFVLLSCKVRFYYFSEGWYFSSYLSRLYWQQTYESKERIPLCYFQWKSII